MKVTANSKPRPKNVINDDQDTPGSPHPSFFTALLLCERGSAWFQAMKPKYQLFVVGRGPTSHEKREVYTRFCSSLVPRPSPDLSMFLRVTLKNWEWPRG